MVIERSLRGLERCASRIKGSRRVTSGGTMGVTSDVHGDSGNLVEIYAESGAGQTESSVIKDNVIRKLRDIQRNGIVLPEEMQKLVTQREFFNGFINEHCKVYVNIVISRAIQELGNSRVPKGRSRLFTIPSSVTPTAAGMAHRMHRTRKRGDG